MTVSFGGGIETGSHSGAQESAGLTGVRNHVGLVIFRIKPESGACCLSNPSLGESSKE